MKKSLKSILFYELFLYLMFALFVYILNKYNHLDRWSFLFGIMLLPITNALYDFIRKFRWKSEKNI